MLPKWPWDLITYECLITYKVNLEYQYMYVAQTFEYHTVFTYDIYFHFKNAYLQLGSCFSHNIHARLNNYIAVASHEHHETLNYRQNDFLFNRLFRLATKVVSLLALVREI